VAPIGPLRGRGGSEWAIGTHAAGDDFVLLDDHIITLDPRIVGDAASASIAAIGSGDEAAVSTPIAGAGTNAARLRRFMAWCGKAERAASP
jgi:hypothetical protein